MKKNLVRSRFSELVQTTFNDGDWLKDHEIELDTSQIEAFNNILDSKNDRIILVGSRGFGKTFTVAAAITKACTENSGFIVIVAGPKEDQAKRIVKEITRICKRSDKLKSKVAWRNCSQTHFEFTNGSFVYGLSASEQAQQEGPHANWLITDEAHRVSSEAMRQRLQPMLSGMRNPKQIKIGITVGTGQFFDSYRSSEWKKLIYPWHKAPHLLLSDFIQVGELKISKLILQYMPLTYKKKYFPENPELHFPGDFDEIDFDTQYEMNWREDVNKLLTEEEMNLLYGEHDILEYGIVGDEYYFGLDFAGGSEITQDKKHDYTSLTIGRKTPQNVKQIVARYKWQGDVVQQLEEIIQIIHPKEGRFKCRFGIGDYTGCGMAPVDMLKSRGIMIKGIMYMKSDPVVGKNYKNSMVDEALYELRWGRLKMPHRDVINSNVLHKEAFNEWGDIERKKKAGLNDEIKASPGTPSDPHHDDMFFSDIMYNYAVDKIENFKDEIAGLIPVVPVKVSVPLIGSKLFPGSMGGGGPKKSILR